MASVAELKESQFGEIDKVEKRAAGDASTSKWIEPHRLRPAASPGSRRSSGSCNGGFKMEVVDGNLEEEVAWTEAGFARRAIRDLKHVHRVEWRIRRV